MIIKGNYKTDINSLDKHLQGVTVINVLALTKLAEIGIEWDKGVRGTQIQRIVDTPVDL
jgi:hypothetical protein